MRGAGPYAVRSSFALQPSSPSGRRSASTRSGRRRAATGNGSAQKSLSQRWRWLSSTVRSRAVRRFCAHVLSTRGDEPSGEESIHDRGGRAPQLFDAPTVGKAFDLASVGRLCHRGDVDHVAEPSQRLMGPGMNGEQKSVVCRRQREHSVDPGDRRYGGVEQLRHRGWAAVLPATSAVSGSRRGAAWRAAGAVEGGGCRRRAPGRRRARSRLARERECASSASSTSRSMSQ